MGIGEAGASRLQSVGDFSAVEMRREGCVLLWDDLWDDLW